MKPAVSFFRSITGMAIMALAAVGCSSWGVERHRDTMFVIALDVTTSVSAAHFEVYGNILRQIVLPLLRPGDIVYVAEIDSDPREDPPPRRFDLAACTRLELPEKLRELHRHVSAVSRRPGSYKGMTDLGGVLSLQKELIETRERASGGGARELRGGRYVTILFTDGLAEGAQGSRAVALPGEIEVDLIVMGIENDADRTRESGLRRLFEEGGLDPARIHFVSFFSMAEAGECFRAVLGRSPDPGLERALESPEAGSGL